MDPLSLATLATAVGVSSAVSGILGNRADDVFCNVMRTVVDRMRRGGPPVNHDLQRAVRKAYLQATLVVCEACLARGGIAVSSMRHVIRALVRPTDELRWVAGARDTLLQELRKLPRAEYIPPSSEADQAIELLLQPRATGAADRAQELRAVLKRALLDELTRKLGAPPAQFQEMVQEGWDQAAGDGTTVHLDWFDLLCAFFVHELKHNQVVANILTGNILANLSVAGYPLTLDTLQASFEQLGMGMTSRLDRIDEQLSELQTKADGTTAALRESIDGLLPTLALLPDVAAQQRAIQAELGLVLRELRRRPLHEQYAGREVADRVDALIESYQSLFVGREASLAELDAFLCNRPNGVLVLTAEAGIGKTALLANWMEQRQNRDCFVAYHFFRSRDDVAGLLDNGLKNILRQLYLYYELSGEPLPDDVYRLRDTMRTIVEKRGAREGEPLVILLDGLDEADRLSSPPFPDPLPEGVFIVVSARAAMGDEPEYLKQNRWFDGAERLHLDRLSSGGIAAWLRHAGDGELSRFAGDDEFVSQVEEKTGGLPLYLTYLTDELARIAEGGGDLRLALVDMPRGFREYVIRERDRLDSLELPDTVWRFFALLAVAKGPLQQTEVKAVTTMRDREIRQMRHSWQVSRWLTITGDGDTALYSFTQPHLASLFGEVLQDDGEEALKDLVVWCARWQEHQSPYALRYYPDHLIQERLWERLVGLLTDYAFTHQICASGILNQSLRHWKSALHLLPQERLADLRLWVAFLEERGHLLSQGDEVWPAQRILLQLAVEHADDSPITLAADSWLETGACDWAWLKRAYRPAHVSSSGAQALTVTRAQEWAWSIDLRLIVRTDVEQVEIGLTDELEVVDRQPIHQARAQASKKFRQLGWSVDEGADRSQHDELILLGRFRWRHERETEWGRKVDSWFYRSAFYMAWGESPDTPSSYRTTVVSPGSDAFVLVASDGFHRVFRPHNSDGDLESRQVVLPIGTEIVALGPAGCHLVFFDGNDLHVRKVWWDDTEARRVHLPARLSGPFKGVPGLTTASAIADHSGGVAFTTRRWWSFRSRQGEAIAETSEGVVWLHMADGMGVVQRLQENAQLVLVGALHPSECDVIHCHADARGIVCISQTLPHKADIVWRLWDHERWHRAHVDSLVASEAVQCHLSGDGSLYLKFEDDYLVGEGGRVGWIKLVEDGTLILPDELDDLVLEVDTESELCTANTAVEHSDPGAFLELTMPDDNPTRWYGTKGIVWIQPELLGDDRIVAWALNPSDGWQALPIVCCSGAVARQRTRR